MNKKVRIMGFCFFGATLQMLGGILLLRFNWMLGSILVLGALCLFFAPFYLMKNEDFTDKKK